MSAKRSPKYLHSRLAHEVRVRRDELKVSQEELAVRCGLHRTYLGAVERGERNVSLATLEMIAEGLDCDPADLIQ